MPEETLQFDAEVGRVLDIVARSLYSRREVFLRELVSNAADACDRLRYLGQTQPGLLSDDPDLRITVRFDRRTRSVSVIDNGVGMTRGELVDHLGTIARSGTAQFVEDTASDQLDQGGLIGQFGVGFYAVFTVGDRVDVLTRRAGESQGWRWTSDGKGTFTVAEDEGAPARGTEVRVHLREDAREFREPERIRAIVKQYSDHIAFPIMLEAGDTHEQVNQGSALWTRFARAITEDQHREFYRYIAHAFDDPWLTVHFKAEGRLEYTSLLYVPAQRPIDFLDPRDRPRVKLYVRRVFVTDELEGLVPPYLRFLRGIVDSEDLPLNISRELVQQDPAPCEDSQGDYAAGGARARAQGRIRPRRIQPL